MDYTNKELVKRIEKARRNKDKLHHVKLKKEKSMEQLETNIVEDHWFHKAIERLENGQTAFEKLVDDESNTEE